MTSDVEVPTVVQGAARQWLADRCHRQRLSPSQRRVARFYIDSMPDGAFLSTMEAAARAGVSQPTVTRFAAALGFATYAHFQATLREVVLGERTVDLPDDAVPSPVDAAVSSLERLRATLDSPAMDAAASMIAGADSLSIVGMRASAALAAHVGFFASHILDDVRLVTDADTAADSLHRATRAGTAAVLVIAMPRYPASTVRSLTYAKAIGARTVLVVDTASADFAGLADHVLVAPVDSDQVFDSHPAPIVLVMTLLDQVASRRPAQTQDRLETHESLVATWVHRADDR
ncbi:MurR/RpiR family transcriptional regulator [Nocardioides sp.]|uniref:MurR/RpiR family transcriptional regulator n=1 Tax=Nocardioides sp. TaxID=35761 RepID=UPI0035B0F225